MQLACEVINKLCVYFSGGMLLAGIILVAEIVWVRRKAVKRMNQRIRGTTTKVVRMMSEEEEQREGKRVQFKGLPIRADNNRCNF